MMGLERLRTLEQVRAFVEGSELVDFKVPDRESAYRFISRTLTWFHYHRELRKRDKGLILRLLRKATGISRSQMTRLVKQHYETGELRDRRVGATPVCAFQRTYTQRDIRVLAKTDKTLERRTGLATRETMRQEYEDFGHEEFERLSRISVSHLYNLRRLKTYRVRNPGPEPTVSKVVRIGTRARPRPHGEPGYLRVDTVHQGVRDGQRGVYFINIVDEVTQFEFVGCVEELSESFTLPVLEQLIRAFPFTIRAVHADNGSEYINHGVERLLDKLDVAQLTKSRPRHCNDNALVESKNASVVRRNFGYGFIHQRFAPLVHDFARKHLWSWLNLHRQCLFPTERTLDNGRIKKRYETSMTPYEKLKSLPDSQRFLRPPFSLERLDASARATSPLKATEDFKDARTQLFRDIDSRNLAA